MLFADVRNVTLLEYRVACRPLTTEEKRTIKEQARARLAMHYESRLSRMSEKEETHLRRMLEEENYLEQMEVLDHVGQTWDLPQ